jgi:hypothetical protein
MSVSLTLAAACVLALAMCSVPLVGIQGTESALVLGVVLPPLCAYACTRITQRYVRMGIGSLSGLFSRTLGFALALWLLPTLILWLDSYRVRNCSPLDGFVSMLLGPGFGVALASVVATGVGLLLPRAGIAPLMAAAVPIATMVRAVLGMYDGPAIFAYGHFFGFFPGTVYDEGVSLTQSFLWLRVTSMLWLLGCVLMIVSCSERATLAFTIFPRAGRDLQYILALLCLGSCAMAELYSDDLGWSSSPERVHHALGGELKSRRCHLHFPREWPEQDRRRLGEDCDFRVQQAERWLGLTHPNPIDVYLFRSPDEKYALMGAAGTNLAKPWRSEVYISNLGWPNPVLGHELVHVVARGSGSGPFRIAGAYGGLWPNPALIEGVATAAAWQPQGGLTLNEWAHAMLELDMVPNLSRLFGPGFFGQQERLAYTLSGSLLAFVREQYGARAVRETYRTGDLAQGVGKPLAEIDAAWRAHLRQQPLAASVSDLARARFSGGGVLSKLCPHTLAKLRDSLRTDMAAGDDASAEASCDRILTIDPRDAGTRANLAALLARQADTKGAEAQLARLLQDDAPAPYVASARQALADQALREGRYQPALLLYQALAQQPIDDDQRRSLQVKSLACEAALSGEPGGERQARLLFELLVGNPGEHTDPATAVYLTRELRALRQDGLPQYLEGRQLFFQARFRYAAELFAQARERGLSTPELRAEALRVEAISQLALGQLEDAARLLHAYEETGGLARRAEARDYQARIRFLQQRAAEASSAKR